MSRRELYVSWWMRFDETPFEMVNNASHKFIRLRAGGESDLRVSWTQKHLTVSNGNAGGESALVRWINRDVWSGAPSAWYRHELWISASEGLVQTWVNGVLLAELRSDDPRYLRRDHPEGIEVALIGWNPSGGTKTMLAYEMDDIVIDDTRAKVMLSDSPAWSRAGVVEYQPAFHWSDTEIRVKVNRGELYPPADRQLYLYVMDRDGRVNEAGFPLCELIQCGPRPRPPGAVKAD